MPWSRRVRTADRTDRQGLARPPGRRARRASGWPPPRPRSSSTAGTPRSRSPIWPPRSPPRSACCGRSRPSSPPTPSPRDRLPAGRSCRPGPLACPAWPTSAGPPWSPRMGDPARFRHGKAFRSFTGLVPKASETGDTDRKGQPMSKAGSSLLRTTLVRAADNARQPGPPARPDLLPADGRTRQGPPRRPVRRRRQPGRTGLDGHAPRHALRHLRHRRTPRDRRPKPRPSSPSAGP